MLKLPYKDLDYRLEELVSLFKEVSACKLCIDFAHIHARGNGSLKGYDDFAAILEYVINELGRSALEDLHINMGGVNYTKKGEKNHLPLLESDFNYVECLKAIKDFNIKGCVILEGPLVEKDPLLLKNTYKNL